MKKLIYGIFLCCLGMILSVSLFLYDEEPEKPVVLLAYEYTSNEDLFPYHSYQEVVDQIIAEPEIEIVDPGVYPEDGVPWLIGLTDEGAPAVQTDTFEIVYNPDGEEVSRILVPNTTWVKEAEPIVYSYGVEPDIGSYFLTTKTTSYGADCVGCGGQYDGFAGTSSGIQTSINSVQQSNGSWLDGITYDGYYLIATDSDIPLCTKVEISNHGWSGKGLTPSQPFMAIVADRGGAIKDTIIDLFVGSEKYSGVTNNKRVGVKIEIVEFGRKARNSSGRWYCKYS